jgi:dihydrofolate synthase/folylpolyglutamate synthase
MDYEEVLDFLYTQLPMYQRVGKEAFKKDMTNTLLLAAHLDNPQNNYKTIHVAGTNGKGSTSHLIASVLQSAGYKVGLYTSPHLKSFRERIRVNGSEVSASFITDFVNINRSNIEKIAPSFFEITVVMAFDYFSKQEVDFAVIETGLGGRLDSTNIITPCLSVITSISMDHEDMLGDSLEKIAIEKAGIVKKSIPIVVGAMPQVAKEEIYKIAVEKSAKILDSTAGQLTHSYASDLPKNVLDLNLNTVLTVFKELKEQKVSIKDKEIEEGILHVAARTGLKGRWQQLNRSPRVIGDVGHNEEAVQWIMSELKKHRFKKLHIVWGVVADKTVEKIFPLMIKECNYYFCAAKVPRAMKSEELRLKAEKYDLFGSSYSSVNKAYEAALIAAGDEDLVFVGGSTFVLAEIKDL